MKVIKRDGHIVDYSPDKIEAAIKKANAEVDEDDRIIKSSLLIKKIPLTLAHVGFLYAIIKIYHSTKRLCYLTTNIYFSINILVYLFGSRMSSSIIQFPKSRLSTGMASMMVSPC